jgi:DNA polymerase epsilon subunit 1
MHEPLLQQLVHKLMKKIFLQLIHQLKLLGCEVVHASFNRLILHTKKKDFEEAHSYVQSVIKTI